MVEQKLEKNKFNANYIKSKISEKYNCELNRTKNRIHIFEGNEKKVSLIVSGHLVTFFKPDYTGFYHFTESQAKDEHRGKQKAVIEIETVDEAINIINSILK